MAIKMPVPAESEPRMVYSVILIFKIWDFVAPMVRKRILSLSLWYLLSRSELINTIIPVSKLNIAINRMINATF